MNPEHGGRESGPSLRSRDISTQLTWDERVGEELEGDPRGGFKKSFSQPVSSRVGAALPPPHLPHLVEQVGTVSWPSGRKGRKRTLLPAQPLPSLSPSPSEGEELESSSRSFKTLRGASTASPKSRKKKAPPSSPPTVGKPSAGHKESYQRISAGSKRLEKLAAAIEDLSLESWATSQNREAMQASFRANPFYNAIRSKMNEARLSFIRNLPNLDQVLAHPDPDDDFLGLSGEARKCSFEAANELKQLRAVEYESVQTLNKMIEKMAVDVPLCSEEERARAMYHPVEHAFKEVIDSALDKKDDLSKTGPKTGFKKGVLSEESICVLQDWLVNHFENPYPTEAEKAELISQTGASMRQITNWFSNARVRIWRPAVDTLGSAAGPSSGAGQGPGRPMKKKK